MFFINKAIKAIKQYCTYLATIINLLDNNIEVGEARDDICTMVVKLDTVTEEVMEVIDGDDVDEILNEDELAEALRIWQQTD